MAFSVTIHYDNSPGFADPHLWVWYGASFATEEDLAPAAPTPSVPSFGWRRNAETSDSSSKTAQAPPDGGKAAELDRHYEAIAVIDAETLDPAEVWARGSKAFVYPVEPRTAEPQSAAQLVSSLQLKDGVFMPDTGGVSGLGATVLGDGRILFGCYHPNAARMYVIGSFNDWQRPGADNEDPTKFSRVPALSRVLWHSQHLAAGHRSSAGG